MMMVFKEVFFISAVDVLLTRRSIRKFKDEPIKEDDLNTILKIGTYAPSGRNYQTSKIVVIQDRDFIDELSVWNKSFYTKEVPDSLDAFYKAPCLLIVLGDSREPNYVLDGCAVLTNLVNGAHAVGVGSCWINRAREEFETPKGKELLKDWGIPEYYEGVGHVILGYADCPNPKPAPRKKDYIHFVE